MREYQSAFLKLAVTHGVLKFGEVKLNFVSETLPLERLADAAKVALVQRNSPVGRAPAAAAAPAGAATTSPGGSQRSELGAGRQISGRTSWP